MGHGRAVWAAHHHKQFVGHIAAYGLTNLFCIARKVIGIEKSREAVRICLQTFEVASIGRAELELADSLTGSDMEDNLVLACDSLARLDAIVTRDPRGFAGSSVAVLSPTELLGELAKQDPSE